MRGRTGCIYIIVACVSIACGGADDKARQQEQRTEKERKRKHKIPYSTEAVKKAVLRGREYLKTLCSDLDAVPLYGYPLGAQSLYAASLVSAGEKLRHPLVVKLYQQMRITKFKKVYSSALCVIALDCYFKALKKKYKGRGPRVMQGWMRDDLEKHINWLVRAQGKNCGGWSYFTLRTGRRFDFSNTQFAVLALGIGQKHGIHIPLDVVERFAAMHLKLQKFSKTDSTVHIARSVDLLRPERRKPNRDIAGNPGGWGYSRKRPDPYFAMTAATLGNLFVARKIRFMQRRRSPALIPAVDGALLWLDRNWKELKTTYAKRKAKRISNYYYTVWTVEKAFDLGEIALIGGRNWYRDEALYLINDQNDDGSWSDAEMKPVATCFALLFLSRSASSKPALTSAPSVFTGGGAESKRDLVFIPGLDGALSAGVFFDYLAETGDERLLDLAEKVCRGYCADYREDLVPRLLTLLSSGSFEIRRFAIVKLRDITGLSKPQADDVKAWYAGFLTIVKAEKRKDPGLLTPLIKKGVGTKLFKRLLSAVERIRAKSLMPPLIDVFKSRNEEERKRLHRAFCFLTGKRRPYKKDNSLRYWRHYVRKEL